MNTSNYLSSITVLPIYLIMLSHYSLLFHVPI